MVAMRELVLREEGEPITCFERTWPKTPAKRVSAFLPEECGFAIGKEVVCACAASLYMCFSVHVLLCTCASRIEISTLISW